MRLFLHHVGIVSSAMTFLIGVATVVDAPVRGGVTILSAIYLLLFATLVLGRTQ